MNYLITLTFSHLNAPVQPSDLVYYVPTTSVGTNTSLTIFEKGQYANIVQFAYVLEVDREDYLQNHYRYHSISPEENQIKVIWSDNDNDSDGNPDKPLPSDADFILFSKSKPNNTSSLVGYYASANFVNDSNKKIELFSVGSEISQSSK